MLEAPSFFEPTSTSTGIQNRRSDVRPPFAVEDRKSVEDTHLAAARRQWEGNGISGTVKMEPYAGSFLLVFISNITREVRDNECF